jgi:hypothetical protein
MLSSDLQRRILKETTIQEVIETALSSSIGELEENEAPNLASELYGGVIEPIFRPFREGARRLLYDYNLTIHLEDLSIGKKLPGFDIAEAWCKDLFMIRLHVSYDFVLHSPDVVFAVCRDRPVALEMTADPSYYYAHILRQPTGAIEEIPLETAMRVEECKFTRDNRRATVSFESVPLAESPLGVYQIRSQNSRDWRKFVDSSLGRRVSIAYTYVSLVPKERGFYWWKVAHPTKTLTIILVGGASDIARVGISDHVVSSGKSQYESLGGAGSHKSSKVAIQGWVLPGSGITCVWNLAQQPQQ